MTKLTKVASMTLMAVALGMTSACTSMISRGMDDHGNVEEVVFPQLTEAAQKRAIFVSEDNLSKVSAGVGKEDLYYLLGVPHFREAHGAREWDYVFKFNTLNGDLPQYCQYKVIFDKDMRAQFFYSLPENCATEYSKSKKHK